LKPKEIATAVIAFLAIGVSVFFMMNMLSPSQPVENQQTEAETIPTVPVDFDENTYKAVENLSDYGVPPLNGIGKSDLFAGY
jgi:large-conductance mechanosensitive channel